MKVTIEFLQGSERIKKVYYYVIKIDYDPVFVHLIQEHQHFAHTSAQILRLLVEDDPETLIF